MATNPFAHVSEGEPLQISAAAWNKLMGIIGKEAKRAANLSQVNRGFDSLYVKVVNKTGKNLAPFDVVGLDGVMSTRNRDDFCNEIVFDGVVPTKDHKNRFAIIQKDAVPNEVVRAVLSGVTVARVKFKNADDEPKTCKSLAGQTGWLSPDGGGAEILWAGNFGENSVEKWAIIRIEGNDTEGTVFPVLLSEKPYVAPEPELDEDGKPLPVPEETKTEKAARAGAQGNESRLATWRYVVSHAITREVLKWDTNPEPAIPEQPPSKENPDGVEGVKEVEGVPSAVDPTASPHRWRRSKGKMERADYGLAHWVGEDGDFVLTWINEVAVNCCKDEEDEEEKEGCGIIATSITAGVSVDGRTWDLTPYQGDWVGHPGGTWRLYESGGGVGYATGEVNEYGQLVGLPSEFISGNRYAGYMSLVVDCPDEEEDA